jgi:hypothetical protein
VRRFLPLSFLLVALLVVPPATALDDGIQYSCSATTGLAVAPVTGGAPQCTFSLVCSPEPVRVLCSYVARVDANGAGLVAARMEIREVLDFDRSIPTRIEWDHIGTGPDVPPSCTGTFTCTAPNGTTVLRISDLSPRGAKVVVTIGCSSGGVAVVETISCSLTSMQR